MRPISARRLFLLQAMAAGGLLGLVAAVLLSSGWPFWALVTVGIQIGLAYVLLGLATAALLFCALIVAYSLEEVRHWWGRFFEQ